MSIAPPPEAPPAPPPVEPAAPESLIAPAPAAPPPTAWRDALPDDLKADKSLESFKDVAGLAKAFVDTKKLVGQRALKPLTAESTPDEVAAYRKAFGIPEAPDGYFSVGVKLPEIAAGSLDEPTMNAFLKEMHDTHAPPKVVQSAINFYAGMEAEKQKAAVRETQAAGQELRREWGPAYDANLGRANRAIQEFGGDALVDRFTASGAGRDPLVVKAFAKIGNALVESGAMDAEGLAGSVTPEEAHKKIGEIRAEMAKLPEGHPRTKDMIDEILALTRIAHKH